MAGAELVVFVDLVGISGVAFENHEFFVIENQIGSFVEGGKNGEGFGKFEGPSAVLLISGRGGFAEFDEAEDFPGQGGADAGDRSGGSAVDEAVVDLGVDSGHEDEGIIDRCDVLGGVAEGRGSTEFLEADEGGELFAELEEEFGFGFEAVVRRVVDDGGQVASGAEDGSEVISLGDR